MVKSNSLKIGDTIGVCAPSGAFDIDKFNSGTTVLEDLGFKVRIPHGIYEKKRYLAGEDEKRARIVTDLFADSSVKAIICARGGYGSIRVLEYLDFDVIKSNPKPVVGFSDTTALLTTLIDRTGQHVIHGPNVVSLADAPSETIDSLFNALTGRETTFKLKNSRVVKEGICHGVLSGGNIATISHMIGTPFQPGFDNMVLFLEDIAEPAYKIDRMLTQMKMAGVFAGIKGVITGSFEQCDKDELVFEILFEVFDDMGIPVLSGLDAGHGALNLSLHLGIEAKLDTSNALITWEV